MHDTEIFLNGLKLNRHRNINSSAVFLSLITERKETPQNVSSLSYNIPSVLDQ